MRTEPSHCNVNEGRVIAFRPPPAIERTARRPAVEDLAKYESAGDEDDYRHRMRVNLVAFAFVILLMVGGVWIADVMAQMRKDQECVMSGRRNCTPITLPKAEP